MKNLVFNREIKFSTAAIVILTSVCVLISVFAIIGLAQAASPGDHCSLTKDCGAGMNCIYNICLKTAFSSCNTSSDCAGTATNVMGCFLGQCLGRNGYPCDGPRNDPKCATGFHCDMSNTFGYFYCEGNHTEVLPYCGDGIKNGDEQCDGTSGVPAGYICTAGCILQIIPQQPTCSISANPTSITEGNYSTLNWISTNATSCTASNAWSGSKSLSGTQSVSPDNDSTYTLTCSGPGGSTTCSASVDVTSNPAPTCSIYANPSYITDDEHSTLNWSSTHATSCTASNAWSGSKSTSGTYSVSPNYDSTYTLTCYSASVSVMCSTHVYVDEDEDNPEISINKTVRNISTGTGFSNSVDADYGDKLEFSLRVESDGDGTADNVRVWDNLPGYLTYISGSTTIDGSYRGDGITTGGINVGDMSEGETHTIKFKVRVDSRGYSYSTTLTNYGYADADNADYVYDTAMVTIEGGQIGTPNLRINKLVRNISNGTGFSDSVSADIGDEVEFSIEINSIGSKEVNNVRVWDNLPSGFAYISGSTTVDSLYRSDGITTGGINIGTMSAGVVKIIKFRANISSVSGTSGITTIDVGSQNVQTSSNLSVSKMGRNITRNQSVWSYSFPAYYGDTLEISVQITNNSGSTINNVTVKENLPSNLSMVSNSTTIDGNYSSGDITGVGINLGTMVNGQVKTIKFRVTVIGGTYTIASTTLNNIAYTNGDSVSQISDQASVVINGQIGGEVLGASVVTGAGLAPFLFVLAFISLIVTFFVYCSTRENQILDYLGKEKGNRILKGLMKFYFRIKLTFKLAILRFKQTYF